MSATVSAAGVTCTFNDGVLTISGSGEVTSSVWSGVATPSNIREVIITGDITTIGASAFESCTALTTITIPASVETIGYSAFYESGLTSVTFETSGTGADKKGVTTIGSYAFFNAAKLTTVTLPDTLTSLGDSAFENCEALTKVEFLGDKPNPLGQTVFYYCSAIEEMKIPCSIKWVKTSDLEWKNKPSKPIIRTNHVGNNAYTNNNDGTHKINCGTCGTLNTTENHVWDDGTTTTNGCITTTSKTCPRGATKDEVTGSHTLVHQEATAANCTTQAIDEHYKCSICGDLFTDSAGTNPTSIAALTGSTDPDNHSLTYTSDDTADTITQGCANGCGYNAIATLNINAAECTYNNGAAVTPAEIVYSGNGWIGGDPTISYENNTSAGTATAKMTMTLSSDEHYILYYILLLMSILF